jgi:hypothetical protein
MNRQLVRIAPWQAAKVSAVMYFLLGLVVAIPMGVIGYFAHPVPGQPKPPGLAFAIAVPFLYALVGLVFVPLACWLYNAVAKMVGGLSFTVEDDTRA